MTANSFGVLTFEDADQKLQERYPDALWFVLSSDEMDVGAIEQRELFLVKMRRQNGISFARQTDKFDGQIVFVGTKAVFGGLI